MKKWTVFFLGIILALIIPKNVYATVIASGRCGDNLTWELSNEYDLVISGYGPMYNYKESYYMPSHTPTNECPPWINYRSKIKSLTLPDGITRIGNYAFYECKNISGQIMIPDTVEEVGHYAFCNCTKLYGDLDLPNITYIGITAFANVGITGLSLPQRDFDHEQNCFSGTKISGDFHLPEGVTKMPDQFMAHCDDLTSFTIPSTITTWNLEDNIIRAKKSGCGNYPAGGKRLSKIVNNSQFYIALPYEDSEFIDSDNKIYTDYIWVDAKNETKQIYIIGNGTAIRIPKIDSENEEQEEREKPKDPNPSTVPADTVQVSVGEEDKEFSNVKVLNQYPHDAINQKLLADMYAAQAKKRATIITQKNLVAPYGVSKEWKKSPHTIIWHDLKVKQGDTIFIVWYTPLYAPSLQMIPATVTEDGTIVFAIPYMGDMSVMSIVKLI